jgi:hypothetical protein
MRLPGSCHILLIYLGELPGVASGFAALTSPYRAKVGLPAVGQKAFIRSRQIVAAYAGLFHGWGATVPVPG